MIELPNGKRYVGQHNGDNLNKRKSGHLQNFRKFKRDAENNVEYKGCCSALYAAICDYSFEDCTWEVIHNNVPADDLNTMENNCINQFNTMVPNGYNQRTNISKLPKKQITIETRQKMSNSQSKVYDTNLENYRRNKDELKDLPKHVIFIKKGERRGYRVVDHPHCQLKDFLSSTESIQSLKQKVIDFLKEIENKPHISTYAAKAEKGIPKGILERPKGFEVQYWQASKRFNKTFTNPNHSKQENLELATEWLSQLKEALQNNDDAKLATLVSNSNQTKAASGIPTGITKCTGGYRVGFNHNKVRHSKSFTSKSMTDEQKLASAIEWMTSKKAELTQPQPTPNKSSTQSVKTD